MYKNEEFIIRHKLKAEMFFRIIEHIIDVQFLSLIPILGFVVFHLKENGEVSFAFSDVEKANLLNDYFASISLLNVVVAGSLGRGIMQSLQCFYISKELRSTGIGRQDRC